MVSTVVATIDSTATVYAREMQYSILQSCLNKRAILPPSIFLWGPNGTGKSFVVEHVLQNQRFQHVAYVSAREIVCGLKPFLLTIVRQLFNYNGVEPESLEDLKCDTIADLIRELQKIAKETDIGSTPLVVVLEESETLRTEHGNVLEVLSRLRDLVGNCNICVTFLSSLPLTAYACLSDMRPMVTVHFPQYSKDELVKILVRDSPPSFNTEVYQFHISMTVSVFYLACRDLRKLQRLAILNYDEFIKPIKNTIGDVPRAKLMELWKGIQPKLTQDFKTLKANIVPANEPVSNRRIEERKVKNFYKFPEMTKYLLISAYLATSNPPSSDKRFFVKSQLGKKRRRVQEMYEQEVTSEPQAFSQVRLFAIYGFLTENAVSKNPLILSQIKNLSDLELLERVDSISNGPLEDPKYKCLASYDLIEDIAKSVDLDLKRYLYSHV